MVKKGISEVRIIATEATIIMAVTIFLFFFMVVIIAKVRLLSKTFKFSTLKVETGRCKFLPFLLLKPFSVKLKPRII
jgi:hypothetical protein